MYVKVFGMARQEPHKSVTVVASEKGGRNGAWDGDKGNLILSEILNLFY